MRGYRISKWLRSSCPSSLLKHGLTEQTFQDHVQMPFEHLQGLGFSKDWDSTTATGKLFQISVTLRVKKCFLMDTRSSLGFSLCPLPLALSLGENVSVMTAVYRNCDAYKHCIKTCCFLSFYLDFLRK